MRIATLFLAAAVSGFVPVLAHATDAAVTPALAATAATPAPAAKSFSEADRAAIEGIIRDYLTKEHPEVLMEAAKELQKRDQATAEVKSIEAITKSKDKIYNDPNSPISGDPKGDVTVVEFFDYNCGYCKMSEEGVEKLLKEDKKIRFIYKEFPILGPESMVAAKASFGAAKQGKYVAFHDALMNKKDHLSDDLIYSTAKAAGLDVDQLKKDMADPATEKMVDDSLKLGSDVGVRGTPMFIINDQIFPGAMQYDQIKKIVDDAHAAAAKKS